MRILEELNRIDDYIRKRQVAEPMLGLMEGSSSAFGLAARAPWNQTSRSALTTDGDQDGIPDALDNYFGPGAQDPSGD